APIVIKSWFGQALTQRLQFNAMSEDEAIGALASVCKAGPESKPQLRALIDYAEAAGIIERANGQLSALSVKPTIGAKPEVEPAREPESPTPRPAAQPAEGLGSQDGGINLQFSVQVTMAEMKDWPADRIAAFFAGVAQALSAKNG